MSVLMMSRQLMSDCSAVLWLTIEGYYTGEIKVPGLNAIKRRARKCRTIQDACVECPDGAQILSINCNVSALVENPCQCFGPQKSNLRKYHQALRRKSTILYRHR